MQRTVHTVPTPSPPTLWKRGVRALLAVTILLSLPLATVQFPSLLGQSHALVVVDDEAPAALRSGDVVFLQATALQDIRERDLVILRAHGGATGLVVREVTGVHITDHDRTLQVEGEQDPVPGDRVVGRVSVVLPAYGHLLQGPGLPDGSQLQEAASALLPDAP